MRLISIAAIAAAAFLAISPLRAQTRRPPARKSRRRPRTGWDHAGDRPVQDAPADHLATLKPAFVQDQPEMEKDFDAIMPVIIKGAMQPGE